MNSYLITGYSILANKTATVYPQNDMQIIQTVCNGYAKNKQFTYFSNTALNTRVDIVVRKLCIQNVHQTDICSDNVLHVICSSKLE